MPKQKVISRITYVFIVHFTDNLIEIVMHCCSSQGDSVLRYCKIVPGGKRHVNMPKMHEGIPSTIKRSGSDVVL